MIIALIAIGLISIMGQVVLLRELAVAFYGIELIYILALGIWLCWTAAGALISGRRVNPSPRLIAMLFLALGLMLPLDVAFIRFSRLLFAGVPGAFLPFPTQLLITALALLPVGVLLGLLFPWAARNYMKKGKTLATAYGIESAGGLAGGLIATLCVTWGLQNYPLSLACGLCSIATAWLYLGDGQSTRYRGMLLLLAGLLLFLLWEAGPIDQRMTSWNHQGLLQSRDSPYGRVTVTRLADQVTVFQNDALAFETGGSEAEILSHLSALQHPHPESILILGGGIEGTVREILKHRPRKIDYIELNPVLLDTVIPWLPEDIRASLREPQVQLRIADPRQFLQNSERYDLILIGMPEPSSGEANRFYTREFFHLCATRLHPGGIVSFRLRTAENLWTPPMARRTASITRALTSAFPHVSFLPGATNLVTASRDKLPDTPEVMAKRLLSRGIRAQLVSPDYLRYLYTNDRFFEIRDILKTTAAPINTDLRPVCYQYTLMIWLSKFFPRLALMELPSYQSSDFTASPWPWIFWASLAVIFILSRLRPAVRRLLLVAVAGFVGMVLETVLLLYYQVKNGILYQDIGLLMMSFMAGLVLGAIALNRLILRKPRSAPAPPAGEQKEKERVRASITACGIGLVVSFVLLSALVHLILTAGHFSGLMPTAFFLGTCGFLVAGIFAYTSLQDIPDQQQVISPLYAADLFGGCLGSLFSSLVLIPFAGLDVTVVWTAILAALSALLMG